MSYVMEYKNYKAFNYNVTGWNWFQSCIESYYKHLKSGQTIAWSAWVVPVALNCG